MKKAQIAYWNKLIYFDILSKISKLVRNLDDLSLQAQFIL